MEKLIVLGIIAVVFGGVLLLVQVNYKREMRARAARVPDLDDQLDTLLRGGVSLAPGRTRDELIASAPEHRYQDAPFRLLLQVLGGEVEAEPWGRRFSHQVFTLDTECIEGDGSYARVVTQLARVAGVADRVTEVSDTVDIEAGVARLTYSAAGRRVTFEPAVQDNWIDPDALTQILGDIEPLIPAGRGLWQIDEGQCVTYIGLSEGCAAQVNAAAPGLLVRV